MKVYVLLIDLNGSTWSKESVCGVVFSEKEAKRFVSECQIGYQKSYKKFEVHTKFEQAINL